MIDIYNLTPHVMKYATSGGIWWIFVFVTDSALFLPFIQPLRDFLRAFVRKQMIK